MSSNKRVGRSRQIAEAMQKAERRRNMVIEHRERARQICAEVRDGISETVSLSEGRGDQFLTHPAKAGEPAKPTRRKTGLETLLARKVITRAKFDLGERWGTVWRMATDDPSIRSGAAEPEGSSGGDPIGAAITQARLRVAASERLAEMNLLLLNQPSLINAMAEVCGRGKTPRAAARNGRDSVKIECLVTVALDMLSDPGSYSRSARSLPGCAEVEPQLQSQSDLKRNAA